MVHRKISLESLPEWFAGVTNGILPQSENIPRFYYNTQWAKEELSDCIATILTGAQSNNPSAHKYSHDITFHVGYTNGALIKIGTANLVFQYRQIKPNNLFPHLEVELSLIKNHPICLDIVIDKIDDPHSLEIKIQWLTNTSCHLAEKWYTNQLFATIWNMITEEESDQ